MFIVQDALNSSGCVFTAFQTKRLLRLLQILKIRTPELRQRRHVAHKLYGLAGFQDMLEAENFHIERFEHLFFDELPFQLAADHSFHSGSR